MNKIVPSLWFDMQCEEAMNHYVDTFNGAPYKKQESSIISITRYEKGMEAPGAEQRDLPAAALLRTVKGDFVFVANGDWYLRTPVQIGAAHGDWLEVTGGLYEGDTVVTQGANALWLAELSATNGGVGCADGH